MVRDTIGGKPRAAGRLARAAPTAWKRIPRLRIPALNRLIALGREHLPIWREATGVSEIFILKQLKQRLVRLVQRPHSRTVAHPAEQTTLRRTTDVRIENRTSM